MKSPAIIVTVPVEGRPAAYVYSESFEDQERVRLELCRPGLEREIGEALEVLHEALEDMSEAA